MTSHKSTSLHKSAISYGGNFAICFDGVFECMPLVLLAILCPFFLRTPHGYDVQMLLYVSMCDLNTLAALSQRTKMRLSDGVPY